MSENEPRPPRAGISWHGEAGGRCSLCGDKIWLTIFADGRKNRSHSCSRGVPGAMLVTVNDGPGDIMIEWSDPSTGEGDER